MKFLKGLYKDSGLVDQPQGTHRDALNMVMNLDKGAIASEYGNTPSPATVRIQQTINDDRKINGSILLPDNKFIVFYSKKYTNTSTSYIYLYDSEGDMMTLLFATSNNSNDPYYDPDTKHLNFSIEYPITGEARVAANGDVIVYFTDNYKNVAVEPITNIEYLEEYNPPRTFNITRQLKNLKDGAPVTALYTTRSGTKGQTTGKNVDALNLFLISNKIPQINTHRVIKGGILETGAYYLCLAYANEDFTETNIYTVSQPVYIPKGNYSTDGLSPAVPFEHMTGAPAGTQTSFGIIWQYGVKGADTDVNYNYLVPYIIKVSGNAREAYKLPLAPLTNIGSITFTGTENYATASVDDIVLDKATYLTAKTLTQLDNKLYLGNITARKDIGYQRFANNIQTVPVIKKVKRFDARVYDTLNLNYGYTQILKQSSSGTYNQDFDDYKFISNYYTKYQTPTLYDSDTDFWTSIGGGAYQAATRPEDMGGYRNQKYASYLKSYRRGEVYALYISFVLNDGTETYAYHVPGRDRTLVEAWLANNSTDVSEEVFPNGTSTSGDIDYAFEEYDVNASAYRKSSLNFDLAERIGSYEYNKINDTSRTILPNRNNTDDAHLMGLWRNESEFYPQTDDFTIMSVDAFGNPEQIDSIQGSRVRHHKFPSNLSNGYSFIDFDRTNLYKIRIPNSGTPIGHTEASMLVNLRTATASWDDQYNQSAFFYETINILGFQFKNIRIPKFILKQIQGFKVYYAKRTVENKTILGQSLLHPSFFRAHGFFSTSRLPLSNKITGPFYRYWSFYANIPDIISADINSYIKYDSKYIGKYYNTTGGGVTDNDTYFGSPIVKFHDFTMLRKKINLNIVDYVSIQSIVTMHQYNGLLRNATRDDSVRATTTITNLKYLAGYKYFQTGQNENEEFSWIHEDLKNLDSKIARLTSGGEFDDFAPHRGPHHFKANVMIGARYNSYYESSFTAYENSTDSFTNSFKPRALANIFTITNNGASYIDGLSYLKVTETDAFHGAQYLDNYAGETAIALSIKSGLPRLLGHITSTDESIQSNLYDTMSKSGSLLTALNPNEIPDGDYATLARGKANIFLANLHSYKTDVFNPFDNQTLVWTGYYHPCQISIESLNSGKIGGVIDCIEFLNYTSLNTYEGITIDASSTIKLTYDLNDPQTTPLEFSATNENGGTFIANEIYNFSIIITDPSMLALGEECEISLGGTIQTVEIGIDETEITGTIVCGIENPPIFTFTLGPFSSYKSDLFISFSQDDPECFDTYNKLYLTNTFQYTDDAQTILEDYSNTNNYYTGLTTGWIFGGDTFIARYNYRMTSSDFPNYYLVQNLTVDTIFPTSTNITPGFGHQMTLPEIIDASPLTPLSNTTPYNDYMGTVAFMNQRVLRTFGTDAWPNITDSGFNLLDHFISLQIVNPVTSGNPDSLYSASNFKESTAFIANSTLYSIFVESDDNLNFRHAGDLVKGVSKSKSLFFDGYNAADVVFRSPLIDLTKQDNLLYEDHYSALQDIKTTIPFPKKGEIETSFPSRVIRSNVQDGRIDDNYRNFLALQYKDFSQNKGSITNLVALNGLLFIHTEKSIYKTTGKQTVQLGDATEAFIGSGDIFTQEPVELVTANEGYGGSFNKHSSIINKYGYAFVSRKEKKVFLLTERLEEISLLGMETWFRLNIPYTLETINQANSFPINLDTVPYLNLDAPTGSFGFISTYDPIFKRFIITKKEIIPSTLLNTTLQYFNPNIVNINAYDPDDCLDTYSNLEPTIPYGSGIATTISSANLIPSYFGATGSASIWYDPNLGVYIFNKELRDILIADGNTDWQDHVGEITLPIYGEDCNATDTFFVIYINNDNYWFTENGWTISFYPDNKSWVSRHSYVSPWYFYNSEYFFSFDSKVNSTTPTNFQIWKHNSTNGANFYSTAYNYEFEFVVNDSPEISKILSSINFIADVYSKDESGSSISSNSGYLKDRLNTYNIELPFNSFYIYNTYQNSGLTTFEYLNNIRRIEGTWIFNSFRDVVRYSKNFQLSDNQYNISGGFNTNVQAPTPDLMFLGEGVINPAILNTAKPWHEQKKFIDKFFAVRLIGQGNNNLVNLYSASATLRKSSR